VVLYVEIMCIEQEVLFSTVKKFLSWDKVRQFLQDFVVTIKGLLSRIPVGIVY